MFNIATTTATQPLTMSSKEIAELTGKEHRNVMRDIRAMLAELHGEGGVLSFEHTHRNEQNGQAYPIFNLPKRETPILVSGYSVELRARIIDRWQELEQQQAKPTPVAELSRLDILRLAIELDESRKWASIKRMEMAYHGQKFDWRILEEAAAEMGIAPRKIFDANYGTVNAYHADVWAEAYAVEII